MFIPGLEWKHVSQPEIVLLYVNEGLSKWKWREEQIRSPAVFLLLWLLTSPRARRSGSGRDEEEHLISIVFMSHCRDSDWLGESKRTWARREEKDRARERASSALSRGQGAGKKRGWWTWEEKESRHRATHISHRLIASLSFHLSLFADTLAEVKTAGWQCQEQLLFYR